MEIDRVCRHGGTRMRDPGVGTPRVVSMFYLGLSINGAAPKNFVTGHDNLTFTVSQFISLPNAAQVDLDHLRREYIRRHRPCFLRQFP